MNLLERRSPTAVDIALYLVGVAGLAASVTLIFLGMRAVMDIGGFCADGGPYVIETHCPDGVPLLMFIAFPGLFLFGGVMLWKGTPSAAGTAAWRSSPGRRSSSAWAGTSSSTPSGRATGWCSAGSSRA